MATTATTNGEASSAFQAALAAAGYQNNTLGDIARVQLAVANLIYSPVFPSGVTFKTAVTSTTAFATPSAFAATQASLFASTVSGAVLMGFGTTYDVTLKNRAGTDVLGIGPNSTTVTLAGALAIGGALSGVTTIAASNVATFTYAGTAMVFTPASASHAAIRFNATGGAAAGFVGVDYGAAMVTGTPNGSLVFRSDAASTMVWGMSTTEVMRLTATLLTVSTALSVTGTTTLDGGLVTYGANDSAGAGYRLVRVPNV